MRPLSGQGTCNIRAAGWAKRDGHRSEPDCLHLPRSGRRRGTQRQAPHVQRGWSLLVSLWQHSVATGGGASGGSAGVAAEHTALEKHLLEHTDLVLELLDASVVG